MEDFAEVISGAMALFRMEFTLYGYTLSFWQIFCFSVVASIVIWIVREVLLGD